MSIVDSPTHRALAKKAAIEGTVLLKNDGHTLPLKLGGVRVAVVGPNANRTMTRKYVREKRENPCLQEKCETQCGGKVTSNYAGCKDKAGGPILSSCTFVNPLEGIRAAVAAAGGPEVAYAQGVDIDSEDKTSIPAAVAAAKDADVVVVVTGLITCQEVGAMCQEAEARDRSTPVNADGTDNPWSTTDIGRDYGIGLPGVQQELLKSLANATADAETKIIRGSFPSLPFSFPANQKLTVVSCLTNSGRHVWLCRCRAVGRGFAPGLCHRAALLPGCARRGGAGRRAHGCGGAGGQTAHHDSDGGVAVARGLPRSIDEGRARQDAPLLFWHSVVRLWMVRFVREMEMGVEMETETETDG